MHPELEARTRYNNHDKKVRLAAALLLRCMTTLGLLSYQGLPFTMIAPWPLNVAEDVRKLSICQEVGDIPGAGYYIEEAGLSYQVVASSPELIDKDSLYVVIEGAITTMTRDPVHLNNRILKCKMADLRTDPEK